MLTRGLNLLLQKMENQIEKNMEDEMETGVYMSLAVVVLAQERIVYESPQRTLP